MPPKKTPVPTRVGIETGESSTAGMDTPQESQGEGKGKEVINNPEWVQQHQFNQQMMAGMQELLQRLDSQSRHGSRSRGRQGNDTIFRSIESQRNNNQNDQDDQGQDDQDQDDQEEDQRE